MSERSLELVVRMRDGDREAMDELLRRHLPGLRGYVRLHSGPVLRAREESTDLVQSVCREVLQHMDRFQYPSEAGFKQWLYVSALRKIRNRYEYWGAQMREVGREVALEDSPASGDARAALDCYASFCTPSRDLQAREEVARIEAAFDRLTPDHREVIVMARILGMSRAEIGERMGRSEGAVRTLLVRATARLAELLAEGGA